MLVKACLLKNVCSTNAHAQKSLSNRHKVSDQTLKPKPSCGQGRGGGERADGREVLVFIDECDKCKDNYGSLVFLTICRNGGGYVMVIFGMDFDFEK